MIDHYAEAMRQIYGTNRAQERADHQRERVEPTGDQRPVSGGFVTLVGLRDAIADDPTLQNICGNNNSNAKHAANDIALTVLNYLAEVAK